MAEDNRLSRRDLLRASAGALVGAGLGAVLPDSCASERKDASEQESAKPQPQPQEQSPRNKKRDPDSKKQPPEARQIPQPAETQNIPLGRRVAGGAVVGALTALVLKRRSSGRVEARQREQQADFEEGRDAEWHWKRTGENTDPDRRER